MGEKLLNRLETIVSMEVKGTKRSLREIKRFFSEIERLSKGLRSAGINTRGLTNASKQFNKRAQQTNKELQKLNRRAGTYSKRIEDIRGRTTGWRRALGKLRNEILLVTFALGGLIVGMKKAVEAAKIKESALIGLTAVAQALGVAEDQVTESARRLTESGLLTIREAADSLKNLLSTGLGLPETERLMQSLTDAAAFNRQGTLKMGEAIVGATQGLKNNLSILVDNAGITKNLSVLQKEFAASIGTTIGNLTEAEKTMANYVGILKESVIFTGNALKVVNTFSGVTSKLQVSMFNLRAEIGALIQPFLFRMFRSVGDIIAKTTDWLKVNKEVINSKLNLTIDAFIKTFVALFKIIKAVVVVVVDFLKALGLLNTDVVAITIVFISFRKIIDSLSKAFIGLMKELIRLATVEAARIKRMKQMRNVTNNLKLATQSLTRAFKTATRAVGALMVQIAVAIAIFETINFITDKLTFKTKEYGDAISTINAFQSDHIAVVKELKQQLAELDNIEGNLNREQLKRQQVLRAELRQSQVLVVSEFVDQFSNSIDSLKEFADVTTIIAASQDSLAESEKKVRIELEKLSGDIILNTALMSDDIKNFNLLNKELKELQQNFEQKSFLGKAFSSEDEERLKRLQFEVGVLKKRLDESINIPTEQVRALEGLLQVLDVLQSNIDVTSGSTTTIDDLLDVLNKDLADTARKFKVTNILGNLLFGDAALELQKKKLKIFSGETLKSISKFFRDLKEVEGGDAFLQSLGLTEDKITEAVNASTDLNLRLLQIEQDFFNHKDILRRKDLLVFQKTEQEKSKLLRDLGDQEVMVFRDSLGKKELARLQTMERELVIEQAKQDELVRIAQLELLNDKRNNKVRFVRRKATTLAVLGLESALAKNLGELFDNRANRERVMGKLLVNIAKETTAVILEGLAQQAAAEAALAAAKFQFAKAAGLAAVAGTLQAVATGIRSRIDSLNAEETAAVTNTPNLNSPQNSGTQTQPIGGLNLGPSFQNPSSSAPSFNVFFEGATFVGAGDAQSLKPVLKEVITEVVNEQQATGEIEN